MVLRKMKMMLRANCPRKPVKERCVADCRDDTGHLEHPG
jgi:hypothetical protein